MALSRKERFLGGLLGGAVGDALGAPYEGLWGEQIPAGALEGYGLYEGYSRGQWTDDTQLTLATVEAILEQGLEPGAIAARIARLWANDAVIGPGGACTRAAHAFLGGASWRACGAPVGQAGNGTAMRAAVLGLACVDRPGELPGFAADVARITHHDARSVAGGLVVAAAAQSLAAGGALGRGLCEELAEVAGSHSEELARLILELPEWLELPRAEAHSRIAWAGQREPELARPSITPFVVPTVLASLYALLSCPDSWSGAVECVLRLGGDVDTTGSIVGALAGIAHGRGAIPLHLREGVVDGSRIASLAIRLYGWTLEGAA